MTDTDSTGRNLKAITVRLNEWDQERLLNIQSNARYHGVELNLSDNDVMRIGLRLLNEKADQDLEFFLTGTLPKAKARA